MDDYVPCDDYDVVFSKSKQSEIWVILLEKAWAKLHGSYERIIAGYEYLTFRDITGAPGYLHETDEDGLWEKIYDGCQN